MKSKKLKSLALERINNLMELAEETYPEDQQGAHYYAQLAYRIALKSTMTLPEKWKRRFCKKCQSFLVPGYNLKVRIHKSKIISTCLECRNVRRIPLIEEKKGIKNGYPQKRSQ